MWFSGRTRGPALPADAAAALALADGAHVIAWSPLVGGGFAAATRERLHVLTPQGQLLARPWVEVERAAWQADTSALAVWWVGSPLPTPLEIVDQSRLPDAVHERVQASVVLVSEVTVPGDHTVRMALRKDVSGRVFAQVAPARGVRLDDPEVAEVLARAQAALLEQAGQEVTRRSSELREEHPLGFGRVRDADPA